MINLINLIEKLTDYANSLKKISIKEGATRESEVIQAFQMIWEKSFEENRADILIKLGLKPKFAKNKWDDPKFKDWRDKNLLSKDSLIIMENLNLVDVIASKRKIEKIKNQISNDELLAWRKNSFTINEIWKWKDHHYDFNSAIQLRPFREKYKFSWVDIKNIDKFIYNNKLVYPIFLEYLSHEVPIHTAKDFMAVFGNNPLEAIDVNHLAVQKHYNAKESKEIIELMDYEIQKRPTLIQYPIKKISEEERIAKLLFLILKRLPLEQIIEIEKLLEEDLPKEESKLIRLLNDQIKKVHILRSIKEFINENVIMKYKNWLDSLLMKLTLLSTKFSKNEDLVEFRVVSTYKNDNNFVRLRMISRLSFIDEYYPRYFEGKPLKEIYPDQSLFFKIPTFDNKFLSLDDNCIIPLTPIEKAFVLKGNGMRDLNKFREANDIPIEPYEKFLYFFKDRISDIERKREERKKRAEERKRKREEKEKERKKKKIVRKVKEIGYKQWSLADGKLKDSMEKNSAIIELKFLMDSFKPKFSIPEKMLFDYDSNKDIFYVKYLPDQRNVIIMKELEKIILKIITREITLDNIDVPILKLKKFIDSEFAKVEEKVAIIDKPKHIKVLEDYYDNFNFKERFQFCMGSINFAHRLKELDEIAFRNLWNSLQESGVMEYYFKMITMRGEYLNPSIFKELDYKMLKDKGFFIIFCNRYNEIIRFIKNNMKGFKSKIKDNCSVNFFITENHPNPEDCNQHISFHEFFELFYNYMESEEKMTLLNFFLLEEDAIEDSTLSWSAITDKYKKGNVHSHISIKEWFKSLIYHIITHIYLPKNRHLLYSEEFNYIDDIMETYTDKEINEFQELVRFDDFFKRVGKTLGQRLANIYDFCIGLAVHRPEDPDEPYEIIYSSIEDYWTFSKKEDKIQLLSLLYGYKETDPSKDWLASQSWEELEDSAIVIMDLQLILPKIVKFLAEGIKKAREKKPEEMLEIPILSEEELQALYRKENPKRIPIRQGKETKGYIEWKKEKEEKDKKAKIEILRKKADHIFLTEDEVKRWLPDAWDKLNDSGRIKFAHILDREQFMESGKRKIFIELKKGFKDKLYEDLKFLISLTKELKYTISHGQVILGNFIKFWHSLTQDQRIHVLSDIAEVKAFVQDFHKHHWNYLEQFIRKKIIENLTFIRTTFQNVIDSKEEIEVIVPKIKPKPKPKISINVFKDSELMLGKLLLLYKESTGDDPIYSAKYVNAFRKWLIYRAFSNDLINHLLSISPSRALESKYEYERRTQIISEKDIEDFGYIWDKKTDTGLRREIIKSIGKPFHEADLNKDWKDKSHDLFRSSIIESLKEIRENFKGLRISHFLDYKNLKLSIENMEYFWDNIIFDMKRSFVLRRIGKYKKGAQASNSGKKWGQLATATKRRLLTNIKKFRSFFVIKKELIYDKIKIEQEKGFSPPKQKKSPPKKKPMKKLIMPEVDKPKPKPITKRITPRTRAPKKKATTPAPKPKKAVSVKMSLKREKLQENIIAIMCESLMNSNIESNPPKQIKSRLLEVGYSIADVSLGHPKWTVAEFEKAINQLEKDDKIEIRIGKTDLYYLNQLIIDCNKMPPYNLNPFKVDYEKLENFPEIDENDIVKRAILQVILCNNRVKENSKNMKGYNLYNRWDDIFNYSYGKTTQNPLFNYLEDTLNKLSKYEKLELLKQKVFELESAKILKVSEAIIKSGKRAGQTKRFEERTIGLTKNYDFLWKTYPLGIFYEEPLDINSHTFYFDKEWLQFVSFKNQNYDLDVILKELLKTYERFYIVTALKEKPILVIYNYKELELIVADMNSSPPRLHYYPLGLKRQDPVRSLNKMKDIIVHRQTTHAITELELSKSIFLNLNEGIEIPLRDIDF